MLWDKSRRSFVLALRSLWLHKLRSFLSVLGIIIGTVSVITLMAFGEGNMHDALEDIKRQGATNLIVRSVKPSDDATNQRRTMTLNYGLTYADYDQFLVLDSIVSSVPMRYFPQEIRNLHRMFNGRVVGTTPGYQNVNRIDLVEGRFLMDSDEIDEPGDDNELRNVVVLGSDVAEALFPFQTAVGKSVVLNKHQFVVVGVLKDRSSLTTGGLSEDFNSDVYIPLSTCRGRYGEKIFIRQSGSRSGEQVELHQVTVTISDMSKVRDAGKVITDQLERSHFKKDWSVTVPLDRLEEAERARNRGLVLLFFIAMISLTVGGIGIMNIMLATVTERTREIGIRRALGAKRSDITLQFLIEATVQTSVGGILGTIVGIGLVFVLPWASALLLSMHLPAHLKWQPVALSISVACFVGVVFGLYPAFRASRLDPIEALRHD
ncbi:MAG: FtsX-like permease family protein [Gemmataceae bacterium]|nr:FtsX-like permease family protein [Gemmataceae bacterium]